MLLIAILKAVLGVFVLMALWVGVQQYIRRRSHLGPDVDVLEHGSHGCASCGNSEVCCGEKKQESHGGGAPRPNTELIEITTGHRKENQ